MKYPICESNTCPLTALVKESGSKDLTLHDIIRHLSRRNQAAEFHSKAQVTNVYIAARQRHVQGEKPVVCQEEEEKYHFIWIIWMYMNAEQQNVRVSKLES